MSPERRGRYRLLKPLGAGGMGVVYLAVHEATGQQVALKTVQRPNGVAFEAMYREIQALGRLRHPGIVRIVDHGVHQGTPWYAMELLCGQTLQDLFAQWASVEPRESPLPRTQPAHGSRAMHLVSLASPPNPAASPARVRERQRRVLEIVRDVSEALAVLHGAGLVHGDLNPANIFICEDGRPVVFDFGLSSRFRREDGRAPLEAAGQARGTLHYMAPEQILGDPVDARADLYGLGCTLFEGLTGQRVFRAETTTELLRAHLERPPRPPSLLVSGVHRDLDMLLVRMLAKEPLRRIGYAEEVVRVVEHVLEPGGSAPRNGAATQAYVYTSAFHGRGSELRQLEDMLEQLIDHRGGVVVLTGSSGSGKTALVSELATRARRLSLHVVMGECQELGAGDSAPVRAMALHPLRPLLRLIAVECLHHPDRRQELLGDRAPTLVQYEPTLREPGAKRADPQERADALPDRVLLDLRQTLEAYARDAPMVLCLDDLQWADALTLRFLGTTAPDFFRDRGILLVGSLRAEGVPAELRALRERPGSVWFDLGPLDRHSVEAMVQDMLALQTPPQELMRFLHAQGEGNPLFVAEYVRAAVTDGLLVRRDTRWTVLSDEAYRYQALPTPPSVRELSLRRLSQQSRQARRLAQAAAVLGRHIELPVLLQVAGVSDGQASLALDELTRAHILRSERAGGVRFAHDRQRETVYSTIRAPRRRTLHRRAAQALEATLPHASSSRELHPRLAHHFRQARDLKRAAHYFELAGLAALRGAATRDAVSHLKQALELDPPRQPLRAARLHRALAEASLELGEIGQVSFYLKRALSHCGHGPPEWVPARAAFMVRQLACQAPYWVRPHAPRRVLASEPQRAGEGGLARAAVAVQALHLRG